MLKERFAELRQRVRPDPAIARGLQALEWCDDVFGGELMWPDVKRRVRYSVLVTKAKGRAYLSDDEKAARLVLSIIAAYCTEQIVTGLRHVYRGHLGIDGQSLRDIAELALSHLESSGWIDYETYQDRLTEINFAVKNAG